MRSTGRKPGIFNTDQGSQFTGLDWMGELESYGIRISMDGKRTDAFQALSKTATRENVAFVGSEKYDFAVVLDNQGDFRLILHLKGFRVHNCMSSTVTGGA
jgi:hypothetical protein